jgi:hypothetical protein
MEAELTLIGEVSDARCANVIIANPIDQSSSPSNQGTVGFAFLAMFGTIAPLLVFAGFSFASAQVEIYECDSAITPNYTVCK